jgi:YVTN family beta-propeller protein
MKVLSSLLSLLCLTFLFISGCSETTEDPPVEIDEQFNGFESFTVAEILTKNCALPECHRGDAAENGLSFESYSKMIKGSIGRHFGDHDHGNLPKMMHGTVYGGSPVVPFDAENSLMYNLITGNITDPELRMPFDNEALSPSQIDILKDWINNGARDFNGNVPFSNSNKVFVCNQWSDEIYVIDANYMVISRILNLDVNPTAIDQPHNVQIKGNYYYVTLISAGQLIKIDASTNQIIGRVTGLEFPGMIAISPDGKTAYVSKSSTATGNFSVIYVIDTETMTRKANEINLPVPGLPHSLCLTRDGKKLYVANMTRDRISVVDTDINEVVDDIILSSGNPVIHEPMHIYLSPDDKYLYVNCRTSSKMLIIDTETKLVLQEIEIRNHPMQSAVSLDGNKIYVVSHHEPVISIIEKNGTAWTKREFQDIDAFHHLYGADLSQDGRYLFITCSNVADDYKPIYEIPNKERPSLLCIFDTQSEELVKVLDIGSYSTGVAARQN